MARRAASGTENVPVTYSPAEFVPSRVLPPNKTLALSLIKVPKFVAESWRRAPSESVAGVFKEQDGKQLLVVRDPETGGACILDALWLSGDSVLVLQRNAKQQLDVLGEVTGRTNFQPQFDNRYQQVLHERHLAEDLQKARGTVEEMRRDPGLDSLHTLFQFYNPKNSAQGADDGSKRGILEAASRSRSKLKRGAAMDADLLKVKLFRMFETAGATGLQVKQIATQTQQPLSYVKTLVEEIAEQRKRSSDRKTVYFLKQHYSMYSAAGEEQLIAKKAKTK